MSDARNITTGTELTINGVSYVVEQIDTADTVEARGLRNLAALMRETGKVDVYVRRPKGRKLFNLTVSRNGAMSGLVAV